MVRNQDQLSVVFLDGFFSGKEPRLDLAKRNEVVRLINENRVTPHNQELENHVGRDKVPLPFG